MKKTLIMALSFILGWSPLLAGTVMNDWMMEHMDVMPPYLAIGIGMLLAWALFGFLTALPGGKRLSALLPLNLPAALVLALLVYQEAIRNAYWGNAVGVYTQFFYLPLLNLSSRLGGGVLYHTMTPAYLTCFLLLCVCSCLGRRLGEKTLGTAPSAK